MEDKVNANKVVSNDPYVSLDGWYWETDMGPVETREGLKLTKDDTGYHLVSQDEKT